jgi:hypothetical protein
MADGPNGFENKVHPATGEFAIRVDVSGRELVVCDNCGGQEVALNGLLCLYCINDPNTRGWYGAELGRINIDFRSDLDPLIERSVVGEPAPRREPNPFIVEQEKKASYPRLKPPDTEKR